MKSLKMVSLIIAFLIVLSSRCVPSTAENQAKFSPLKWKQQLEIRSDNSISRLDQFSLFLHDYDLIGMNRSTLVSLLGEDDRQNAYLLFGYGDSLEQLQIQYENDRVKQFRVCGESRRGTWAVKNMLWVNNRLQPKNESPSAGASTAISAPSNR